MATITAQRVFDLAMGLMGEVNEATGATDTSDTREYKSRTLLLLNVLKGELFPYSDTYTQATAGVRPACAPITDFTTPIGIDDVICETVMPYGLAALLLTDENANKSNFFQQKYEELKVQLRNTAAEFQPITNVYNGIENCEFSRW